MDRPNGCLVAHRFAYIAERVTEAINRFRAYYGIQRWHHWLGSGVPYITDVIVARVDVQYVR